MITDNEISRTDSEFATIMEPLDTILSMHFKFGLDNEVIKIFDKYKEKSLGANALKEVNNEIKQAIPIIHSKLSKSYLRKLHKIYSNDGLIYYCYLSFMFAFKSELQEKIDQL